MTHATNPSPPLLTIDANDQDVQVEFENKQDGTYAVVITTGTFKILVGVIVRNCNTFAVDK